jgi:hypothetical protein
VRVHVAVQLLVAVPVEPQVLARVLPQVAVVRLLGEPPVLARVLPQVAVARLLGEPLVPTRAQLPVAEILSVQEHFRNKQLAQSAILHQPAVPAFPIQTSRPLRPYSDALHMKGRYGCVDLIPKFCGVDRAYTSIFRVDAANRLVGYIE